MSKQLLQTAKGLAIGSPISPVLAEIFVNGFEKRILKGSVNVDISNNAAMQKRISNDQTMKRKRRKKTGRMRSPVDNATVSTLGIQDRR